MRARALVARFLPGWKFDSEVCDYPEESGVLVRVQRYEDSRGLVFRQVWIEEATGEVTDARCDDLGYVVDANGVRF